MQQIFNPWPGFVFSDLLWDQLHVSSVEQFAAKYPLLLEQLAQKHLQEHQLTLEQVERHHMVLLLGIKDARLLVLERDQQRWFLRELPLPDTAGLDLESLSGRWVVYQQGCLHWEFPEAKCHSNNPAPGI